MAGTIYIRQSSFADGDTITAALFNNEFNQLANAFAYTTSGTTGHTHDGTDGQGGNISKIGDQDFKNKIVVDSTNNRWGVFVEVGGVTTEQVRIQDGAFVPVVDSDINLGSPTAYFKDSYIDTVTTTGAVTVGGALSAASFAIGGTALTATITELNTLDGITSTVTELNYTDGVTSNIQTQLNAKQPLDAQLTDIAALTPIDGTFIVGDGTNFVAEAPATALASLGVTSTATELNVLDGITTTTAELNYVHNVTSPIQTQLDAKQALNAKLTDISNLTLADNFFLVSTGSNLALESPATALTSLGVTATAAELNYVDGVTSNVQTQLDTKAPLSSPTFTGTLTAPIINASSDLKIGGTTIAATATELNYLSGVTSSVQTQLDALQASDTDLSAIAALTPSDSTFIVGNGTSWVSETGATVRTSLGLTIGTDVAPIASPTFTGTVTADGLSLGDNDKATFGNSNDLEIYHDGSNSYIAENGTGNLVLKGTNLTLESSTGENYFVAFSNADTRLYYDNAQKLATTSTGIDVTGTATMDGLTASASTADYIASITNSNGTDAGGGLFVSTRWNTSANSVAKFVSNSGSNAVANFAGNGDISFYEDTGATPKFFWDASEERLNLGDSASPRGGAFSRMMLAKTTAGDINWLEIQSSTTGRTGVVFSDGSSGNYGLVDYDHTDDHLKILTASVERLRIDSSGNVGIGTSSPQSIVHIDQGASGDAQLTLETHAAGDSKLVFSQGQTAGNWAVGYDDGGGATENSLSFAYKADGYPSLSGQNKMILTPTGNVGIGTSSPSSSLTIREESANHEIIEISRPASDVGALYLGTVGTNDAAISANNSNLTFGIAASGVYAEKMRIDGSGNVGIGTSSPSVPLEVYHATNSRILASTSNTGASQFCFGDDADDYVGRIYYDHNGDTMRFHANGAERLRIDSSGNVGIGTSSPSYALDVVGQANITSGARFGSTTNSLVGDFG